MYVCGVLGGKAQMCHFAGNDLGHGVPQTELTWMQWQPLASQKDCQVMIHWYPLGLVVNRCTVQIPKIFVRLFFFSPKF